MGGAMSIVEIPESEAVVIEAEEISSSEKFNAVA